MEETTPKNLHVIPEEDYQKYMRIKKANSLADELADIIATLSSYQKAEIIERILLPCPNEVLKILRIR
ncbi:hypothetical protein [uncultured Dubosiella sp.]|uniref:hypothetical protein n=1 Tax=uncultured Dubosiella sp. TaxID=1937011 RepID=UPI00260A6239|nr:hypothetical protein [uncultured Dubosiella sp.]